MLSDSAMAKEIDEGGLAFTPFYTYRLGPNSYDVSLARRMMCFNTREIDTAQPPDMSEFIIGPGGYVLEPGILYLGVTQQHVRCSSQLIPDIDGRSSVGREGISIHCTAGRGDAGFCGHFTLEMWCVQPVRVYADMPIGQIYIQRAEGEVLIPYGSRVGSSYQQSVYNPDPSPSPSELWRKFPKSPLPYNMQLNGGG